MEEIGIQIQMNGKIKISIQHKNVHGIIIYHHQIITIIIINGMEIIIIISSIIIMHKPIMINGNLLINPKLNNHKIHNYLI